MGPPTIERFRALARSSPWRWTSVQFVLLDVDGTERLRAWTGRPDLLRVETPEGRTIIPGRIQVAELQVPIGCGGVQVRPGDIVGCDDDGLVVVPLDLAKEVAVHARAVLLADMRARRGRYERLGMPPDETVNYEAVEEYYRRIP